MGRLQYGIRIIIFLHSPRDTSDWAPLTKQSLKLPRPGFGPADAGLSVFETGDASQRARRLSLSSVAFPVPASLNTTGIDYAV